jgi:uncharacterized protein
MMIALPASPWRQEIRSYVRCNARPVEKLSHQSRLYELAQRIGEGINYDDDVVFAAAWMHDLGVFVGHRPEDPDELATWDMVAYAVNVVPELLTGFGFPAGKITAVLDCIRTHQPQHQTWSIEAMILRDADILEQLGAVGILRTVCKVGRDTRFHTFTDAVRSLERAVETLPVLIRLPLAQELAIERVRVQREWLRAVKAEAGDLLG